MAPLRTDKVRRRVLQLRQEPTPVLKNLTFAIQPQEKVGVVGRTGASKSSIVQALWFYRNFSGLRRLLIFDFNVVWIRILIKPNNCSCFNVQVGFCGFIFTKTQNLPTQSSRLLLIYPFSMLNLFFLFSIIQANYTDSLPIMPASTQHNHHSPFFIT